MNLDRYRKLLRMERDPGASQGERRTFNGASQRERRTFKILNLGAEHHGHECYVPRFQLLRSWT